MKGAQTMITEQNIYEKGMLITLNQGNYAGRKKLSKEQMGDLPTEIVRGVHDLFDKEFKSLLKEISAFDNETRHLVKRRSVPFPIDGVYFIPSRGIESIINFLEGRKADRAALIQKAVDNYETAIENFAVKYPDYYNHAKSRYLPKHAFENRFYCKYQFLKISAPNEENSLISPELYQTEMRKFRETIEEMKREVVGTIYQELLETTARLKKQCTDGKPSQRTLNSLNEYLVRIDEVYAGFVDREDLVTAIQKVKAQVLGITAEELRDSDKTRESFRKSISAVMSEIQNLPDIPLKRSIEF
jgi:hypothetical protein